MVYESPKGGPSKEQRRQEPRRQREGTEGWGHVEEQTEKEEVAGHLKRREEQNKLATQTVWEEVRVESKTEDEA